MRIHFPFSLHWLPLACALSSLGLAGAARAEAVPGRAVAPVEIAPAAALPSNAGANAALPGPSARRAIEIGSATEALWALQRASRGTHPRGIDGEQASRSYQRYLKSFETEIPERYNAGLGLQK